MPSKPCYFVGKAEAASAAPALKIFCSILHRNRCLHRIWDITWESGRGYPSIDSLKEISKFFSVMIDELICSEEIIVAAKDDKERSLRKLIALICSLLDVFVGLLLFIPVFGNGTSSPSAVSLLSLTGIQQWIKYLLFGLIIVTVLNGIFGVVICGMDKPVWVRHRIVTGMIMVVVCSTVFILTRQPYAGIICFSVLIVKGFLIKN